MPALYALGQHAALSQVNATLREGEMLFAYLDEIYVLCDPDRVAEIFVQVPSHPRQDQSLEWGGRETHQHVCHWR